MSNALEDGDVVDQAIDWHLRQDAMDAADWHAFTAWLEASEAHARAYDSVARGDRLLADVRFPAPTPMPLPVAANDDAPARRWWWAAGASGIAAALALLVVPLVPGGGGEQRYVTRDGERRALTLPDGSEVAMNGGTALVVERGGRAARLERGEVMLRVVHDPAAPFTLRAGDQVIEDVGTRFDVARGDRFVTIAVAEGAVALRGATPVQLNAGDALTIDAAAGTAVRGTVVPDTVGGWRSGELSFTGTPLAEVAAALRRREGLDIVLAGDLPDRPFTGMIRLTGTADRDIPHLAELIGATWRRDGKRWVLAEQGAAAR